MTTSTIKFLLVDDLEANLLALEALLQRDGLELLKARSGPEALELLLVNDISLALLDVQMPGLDGFELAELMRGTERTRRVPIIFLTAGAIDQQRRFRGYEAGAVDFIFKPIEPHILQSKAGIFFELAMQREALRQNAEEAQAASRAKDDFLAALSHELRTPLTPVLMSATSLQEDERLPADVRDQLAMMRHNVELEARLIDDLLDVTRISRGKLTIALSHCDIHDMLRHSEEIVRSDGLGSRIETVFDLQASHHHAQADAARLHQVFWNLLKNALKFTAPGGKVTVSTRNNTQGQLVLTVTDTGVGIRREILPRIFRAFEQGDISGQHRFGGLGLGLAISKAIVEAHHGELHADSPGPGQGATFTVVLNTVSAADSREKPRQEAAPAKPALRLLIVEDHEATQTTMARLLRLGGHHVSLAGTVAEAEDSYTSSEFDVVISDLGLPDGNGLELMQRLQEIRPVYAIALSGYGMEEDVQKSRQAGFNAHLTKPVSIASLRMLIDQIASASSPS